RPAAIAVRQSQHVPSSSEYPAEHRQAAPAAARPAHFGIVADVVADQRRREIVHRRHDDAADLALAARPARFIGALEADVARRQVLPPLGLLALWREIACFLGRVRLLGAHSPRPRREAPALGRDDLPRRHDVLQSLEPNALLYASTREL